MRCNSYSVIVWFLVLAVVDAGKTGKKKSQNVQYNLEPQLLDTLEKWYNLGRDQLRICCREAGLALTGTITQMATRLFEHHHGTLSQSQQGKRVFLLIIFGDWVIWGVHQDNTV